MAEAEEAVYLISAWNQKHKARKKGREVEERLKCQYPLQEHAPKNFQHLPIVSNASDQIFSTCTFGRHLRSAL
jgi:hypothetical protein